MIYRGMWCPFCKTQPQELNDLHARLPNAGVTPIPVSADTRRCASIGKAGHTLDKLNIGYEVSNNVARALGCFTSKGFNDRKMPLFCDPATFLPCAETQIQAA